MSESEARSQAFVSGFCIRDGVECWRGLMGHGRILLSVDWARSQLFFVNLWKGGLLSGLLPQGYHQKRNSKAEPLGRVKGQPELWLKIGAWQAQYAVSPSIH